VSGSIESVIFPKILGSGASVIYKAVGSGEWNQEARVFFI
jgi:hypothetical protein